MAKHLTKENIKTGTGKMSHNHRTGLMRWLNENISNINISESVILIESLLREFLRSRAESKKKKTIRFCNFDQVCTLQWTHSIFKHQNSTQATWRAKLYSGQIQTYNKQMKTLGRTLCNFTTVAIQVKPNMERPDPSMCPCRHNRIISALLIYLIVM